jgi:hypothetical protein
MRPSLACLLLAGAAAPVLVGAASPHAASRPPSLGPCELATADRRATPSHRCVACHDGTIAASWVPLPLPGTAGDGEHPVEVDYERARIARRDAHLRPASELPASLPLVGGKVACTTCHAADSKERGHVAVTLARSAMCFACHAL